MSLVSLAAHTITSRRRRRTGVPVEAALNALRSRSAVSVALAVRRPRSPVPRPVPRPAPRPRSPVPRPVPRPAPRPAPRPVPRPVPRPAPRPAPVPRPVPRPVPVWSPVWSPVSSTTVSGPTILNGNAQALEYVSAKDTHPNAVLINTAALAVSPKLSQRPWKTEIRVVQDDTLHAAEALAMTHPSARLPVVLNFANAKTPGGGARGAKSNAQEESICYRTDLLGQLEAAFADQPPGFIMDEYEVFYVPRVTVYLDPKTRDNKYAVRARPFDVKVISAAAIEHPELSSDGQRYGLPVDEATVEAKMRGVLLCALAATLDPSVPVDVVLGAWGCGVFGNPPAAVAELWLKLLNSDVFKNQFGRVVFAVYDTPTYDIFRRVITLHKPTAPRASALLSSDDESYVPEPTGASASSDDESYASAEDRAPPRARQPNTGLYGSAQDLLDDFSSDYRL